MLPIYLQGYYFSILDFIIPTFSFPQMFADPWWSYSHLWKIELVDEHRKY